METRKRVIASAIGSALFCLVALLVAPDFWWLGALAGAPGGWIACDFRALLGSVPAAWQSTKAEVSQEFKGILRSCVEWCSVFRAFVVPGFVIGILVGAYWCTRLVSKVLSDNDPLGPFFLYGATVFLVLAMIGMLIALSVQVLSFVAFIGARFVVKEFWTPFICKMSEKDQKEKAGELRLKGLTEKPLTYGNVGWWTFLGVLFIVRTLLWVMWVKLAIFAIEFMWKLFVRVHSENRSASAVDSCIGGAVACYLLRSHMATLGEKAFFVMCGAIFGAVAARAGIALAKMWSPARSSEVS